MDENVSVEKKLSEESEEYTGLVYRKRKAESKSTSHLDDQPMGKPEHGSRRSRLFRTRSNFRRVGYRKQDATKSDSADKESRPLLRAHTLMHLSPVHNLPASPAVNLSINKETEAAIKEFRSVLSGLTEQVIQTEKRFDKQLGAYHKRFEKMEKMQLTILANIQKLAMTDQSSVKTIKQDSLNTEIKQDLISSHII